LGSNSVVMNMAVFSSSRPEGRAISADRWLMMKAALVIMARVSAICSAISKAPIRLRIRARKTGVEAISSGATPASCRASAPSMKLPIRRIIAACRAGLAKASISEKADWRRNDWLTS